MKTHRLQLEVEVPAMPGTRRSMMTFQDMLEQAIHLLRQGQEKAESRIAAAKVSYSITWDLDAPSA